MIRFRPHHFMCAISFKGLGYSPLFVKNYWHVVNTVRENQNTSIKVTYKDDVICSKCPHLLESGECTSQAKIEHLDKQHAKILQLQDGEILTWAQALSRIKQNMSIPKFHEACVGCEWKSLGICEEALTNLLKM